MSKIKEALLHVQKYYPYVVQVFYGIDQRWLYCGEGFESPIFGDEIDINLLEEAVDEVETFPSAFSI